MSNVPANGASQEEKIAYIKKNFGGEMAEDLLEAAGSGTMPEVLHDFLQYKFDALKMPNSNTRCTGGYLVPTYLLGHKENAYDINTQQFCNCEVGYTYTNSNRHDLIEQALLKATEIGNKDFLQAFIACNTYSPIKEFIDSSSSTKELPLKMVEIAIKNNQIETLNLLLNNEYIYKSASNPYPATTGNWGKEVENEHNRILDLVTKYASTNPKAVAYVIKNENIMGDAEQEINRAKTLEKTINSLSLPTQSPEVVLQLANKSKTV